MWVTKLLISPVKKRIFCPKTTKFGPKLAFLVNLGQAMQAYSVPCWWLWRAGCISQDTYLLYILNANPYTVTFQGAGAYPRSSGHNCCRNTPGQVPHLRAHPWRSSVEVPEPLQEPQPHHSPGHSRLLAPSHAHILYRAAPRLAFSPHAMWL